MDKNKIKQLADHAVSECCGHSPNGRWTISYDELYHHFGAEVSDTTKTAGCSKKNCGREKKPTS